jgi:hypothetical protein
MHTDQAGHDLGWRDTGVRQRLRSAAVTTHTTAAALFTAAVVLVSACNSDNDKAPPTTTVDIAPPTTPAPTTPAPTTPAPTTAPPTATSPVATTQPPTSVPVATIPPTAPPATSPPTAPPSTLDPEDQAMAEAVERDWREAMRLFREAQMNPTDATALERVLAHVTAEWTDRTRRFIARLAESNLRILAEPQLDPTLTVESGPVPVPFTSDEVAIVGCEIDPWVLVEVGTGPGGTDTVVNQTVIAYRHEVRLRFEGGIWKIVQVNLIEKWEDTSRCGE